MKTILDEFTRNEIIKRIESVDENSRREWGKMNVYQMLKHCNVAEEMYLGKSIYGRTLLGRIIGKVALKGLLKDERPMGRNAPTSSHFIIKEFSGNIAEEKRKWIALIRLYADFNNPDFEHWFFGKMTMEQVGQFVYKHADHHLRQFNQ